MLRHISPATRAAFLEMCTFMRTRRDLAKTLFYTQTRAYTERKENHAACSGGYPFLYLSVSLSIPLMRTHEGAPNIQLAGCNCQDYLPES